MSRETKDSEPATIHTGLSDNLATAAQPQATQEADDVASKNKVRVETNRGAIREIENGITVISDDQVVVKTEKEGTADSGCGWHVCFRGSCVRHSRTAKWLLFWMCSAVFALSMMLNGFMNVNVTTIEKRYQLKSRNSGLIISSWDIGSVSSVIPLSYIGSRSGTSKPLLLGVCILMVGLGCYTAMLPHFLVPPYDASQTNDTHPDSSNLCRLNSSLQSAYLEDPEEDEDAPPAGSDEISNFLYLFLFASFIMGLFASPVFPVGASFIDESVTPEKSAFYLGILMTAASVGPSIAFAVGGELLKVFVDAPSVDPAQFGLTPSSGRWLGAWWISYGITGTLAVVTGLNVLMIPRTIPKKTACRQDNTHDKHVAAVGSSEVTSAPLQQSPYQHLNEFYKTSQALLKNMTFVLLSLGRAGETFLFAGIVPFLPKFMETQFGVSAGLAAMSLGVIGLIGGTASTLLGGWLIAHFKMSCKSVLRFCFFVTLSCMLSGATFLTRCPNLSFAGATAAYSSSEELMSPNVTSSCNMACSCSDVRFNPVCGANNIIYFSPCHAGCTQSTSQNGREVFSDCACISSLRNASLATAPEALQTLLPDQAVVDTCPSECGLFGVFIATCFVLLFLTILTSMPYINATMRCVAFDQRAYAMGLQNLPLSLLGTVPGPIVFGAVVDRACLVWSEPAAGTGACVVYDNYAFGRYIFSLTLGIKVIVAVCLFFAWMLCGEDSSQVSDDVPTNVDQPLPSSYPLESKQLQDGDQGKRSSSDDHSGHSNPAFTYS